MLKTKCILFPKNESDGLRISVMSRHTLDDGFTPHFELNKMCDAHYSILGPTPKLIGSWLRNEIEWEEYERRFYNQIKNSSNAMHLLSNICQDAEKNNITFLCKCCHPAHCHRLILSNICHEINPDLIIKHWIPVICC